MLAVVLKPENRVIGHMVFEVFNTKYRTREIGWVFNPNHHQKGYATEAAARCRDHAFEALDQSIVATVTPEELPGRE